MKQSSDNASAGVLIEIRNQSIDARIFRTMAIAIGIAVIASVPLTHWRITTGLLLGGALSLVNHYWLITSTTAAFRVVAFGEKPRLSLVHYILRYFFLAVVVVAAYKLNLVSLVATIAGLCSFVVALFAEALREFYFAIIHREEIS